MNKYICVQHFQGGRIMNNLQVIDFSEDNENEVYYVSRINEKLPWTANGNIAAFVMKGNAMRKYKILSIGDDNVKVVSIKK